MSDLKKKFGLKLRRIRRDRDMTQEQLAERCGISADYVSNMERGNKNPSFEMIAKLAEVLEVEVSELFVPIEKK
jgi:transcriptional regulator with XRE-family HTH domain